MPGRVVNAFVQHTVLVATPCSQDNRPTLPNMDDETIDPDLRELGASLLNSVLS